MMNKKSYCVLLFCLGMAATVQGQNGRRFRIVGKVAGPPMTLTLCGHMAASTATDAAGNYTFSGLENGRYVVLLSSPGYVFTPEVVPVDITNSDISGVDFVATAGQPSGHTVKLNWTPSLSPGIRGYHVYRSTVAGGPYATVNDSALIPDNSFVDTQVEPGHTYYYVSHAVDDEGADGLASSEIRVEVPKT